MAFISYYFHWSSREVLEMEHKDRRRWCKEISSIHKSLTPDKKPKEKSIFDMKATR